MNKMLGESCEVIDELLDVISDPRQYDQLGSNSHREWTNRRYEVTEKARSISNRYKGRKG